jgi:zinc transport system ATP-binding protein
LARLLSGSIDVFGEPVGQFRQRWRIGYVPQRHSVAGGIPATVTEVVASGRLPRRKPWQHAHAVDRQRVRDAIAAVGLIDKARAPVAELSGGQQRRVLIARALAADADALILDEPTAGVDSATQVHLTETLAELAARQVTIVLVTHELGPAASIVTRTLQLRDGAIVYDGPPRPIDIRTDDTAHHHTDGDVAVKSRSGFGLTG